MTATLTACQSCGAELTGGADTFGGVGETFCFGCFTSPGPDGEPMLLPRPKFLVELIGKLRIWIEASEEARADMQRDEDDMESRIRAIDRELGGGPRCSEEEK